MKNSNLTEKVLGAVIVGTLVGATLGILFAPYKGSRTRNRIARRSKDLSNKMLEEANVLINKAEELERVAEEKLRGMSNKVKQKVESFKNSNVKDEINNI